MIPDLSLHMLTLPRRPGASGMLELLFARYVPLASRRPYPIIVYSVTNYIYRPHLNHFWANM